MNNRAILILGGSGFVGGAIASALLKTDWATPVIGARRVRQSTCEARRVDVTQPDEVAKALHGVDAVVNCVTGSEKVLVEGAHNLGRAARLASIPVVHLSSMAAYGSVVGRVLETSPLLGDLGTYSRGKAEAERLLHTSLKQLVVLRPGIIYGPGSVQWSERVARWLRSGRVGDLGPDGDGLCNLVHIDDVARIVLDCLRDPTKVIGQAYNLSTPEPPTWNEYFVTFGRALGYVPLRRIPQYRRRVEAALAYPAKAAELALRAMKIRARLDPIGPSYWSLWRHDMQLDVRKAEGAFGSGWIPWRTAVAETARSIEMEEANAAA